MNSLSWFQSHIAGCSHLAKLMSWPCHIVGCNNFIRRIENRFSPYFISFGFLKCSLGFDERRLSCRLRYTCSMWHHNFLYTIKGYDRRKRRPMLLRVNLRWSTDCATHCSTATLERLLSVSRRHRVSYRRVEPRPIWWSKTRTICTLTYWPDNSDYYLRRGNVFALFVCWLVCLLEGFIRKLWMNLRQTIG